MWPRRAPRVRSFDDQGLHRYFVTIGTRFRSPIFADAGQAGDLAAQISPFFVARHFDVLAYCVMPDHLHLLLEGTSDESDLREAVRAWKQRTGFHWKRRARERMWQPGFHDHVLREHDATHLVVRYILNNPVRAGLVSAVEDYPWAGSSRYTLTELQAHAGEWRPSWKPSSQGRV